MMPCPCGAGAGVTTGAAWSSVIVWSWGPGMAGWDDGGGDGMGSERILNQDEIDSLLGFDLSGDGGDDRTGIRAIINSALVSYERLPMLEIVFDRLVRLMTTSLRNFTSDNVEVSLDNITSIRFGDYLNSIPLPAMLTVFKAEEWDNFGLMTVDSSMIYSIVDVLLGGRRGTAAMRVEGRPYTTIERTLVERMIHVVLADLSAAFDPLSPVTFRFDRLETNPRFATISQPSNATIVARLRIDMEDRGGRLEILIPFATLEPVRELLLQMFMGEKFGRDSIWQTHLAEEMWFTEVPLEAVLDTQVLPLSRVLELKVGSKFLLNATPDSFSDGGRFYQRDAGLKQAEKMIAAGVDIIDIGGESTRPGAEPVPLQEELDRVLPVIEALKDCGVALSIDTYKPQTMQAALDLGVDCVNDIWALRQEGAVDVVRQFNCGIVLMHMQRDPQTMQFNPDYKNVVQDVQAFLLERCAVLEEAGIDGQRIAIDPGFGFGKSLEHNYQLLANFEMFTKHGYPALAGISRKSMLGKITNQEVGERLIPSIAAAMMAVERGALIVRTHDVSETMDALKIWQAMREQELASFIMNHG